MRASSRVRPRSPLAVLAKGFWKPLATEILASPSPYSSPHLEHLYALALSEGRRQLSSYHEVDVDRGDDLVRDLLLTGLRPLLEATRPRTLFRVMLRNRARSWLRRRDARVESDGEQADAPAREDVEDALIFRIDALRALSELPARERSVLLSVSLGDDREDVALAHGTSVANVDQIASRARRRLGAPHSRSRAA